MEVTFTYSFNDYDDFDYPVSEKELRKALATLIKRDFLKKEDEDTIISFIDDFDLTETLYKAYICDLRHCFTEEAYRAYRDSKGAKW